jgi:hypothetical protein
MAVYSLVSHFHRAKFYGMLASVFYKLECAAGGKRVEEHYFRLSEMHLFQ